MDLISKLCEHIDANIENLYQITCFKESNPQVNSDKLGGKKIADTFLSPEKTQNQKHPL